MNNKFICGLASLAMLASFNSCRDDEYLTGGTGKLDREIMPMFRTDNNTGKGSGDEYQCTIENVNTAHLYWYEVIGCAGYQVKYALQGRVSSGEAADWENPDNILGFYELPAEQTELVIPDLDYKTQYYFAIRALSTKGEGHHSKWYGYGGGQEWSEYFSMTTEERYATPEVLERGEITKTSVKVLIERDIETIKSTVTTQEKMEYDKYFAHDDADTTVFRFDVFSVSSPSGAYVPEEYKNYQITEEDFVNGYILVDGLDMNSSYVFTVEDTQAKREVDGVMVPKPRVDRIYNTLVLRTKGDPTNPILLKHYCNKTEQVYRCNAATGYQPQPFEKWLGDTIPGAIEYNACRIDTIISNFTNDPSLPEGQVFYLEGGKTYYFYNSVGICKGFTLATDPRDVAQGKRAKVLLSGMSYEKDDDPLSIARQMNFMFGRMPLEGELGGIVVEDVKFLDIDFDCPKACNYSHSKKANGNYFINMYSTGMAVMFENLEIRNCSFQGLIRGFLRTQGSKRKNFEHILVDNCLFYNCGFYDANGGGYAWIHGEGSTAKCNVLNDVRFTNNTFYDSPKGGMFTANNKSFAWPSSVHYRMTLENNTIVNFGTRHKDKCKLFDFGYMPDGSEIHINNNLFIQAKAEEDQYRNMMFYGSKIVSSGVMGDLTIDVADNYMCNWNPEKQEADGIFTSNAFSATSNSLGAFSELTTPSGDPAIVNGKDELKLKVGAEPLLPTELMRNPNPENYSDANCENDMHHCSDITKLFYNSSEKVMNHEIYTKNIGDQRWKRGTLWTNEPDASLPTSGIIIYNSQTGEYEN